MQRHKVLHSADVVTIRCIYESESLNMSDILQDIYLIIGIVNVCGSPFRDLTIINVCTW